jgi:hypothetical protein
MVRNVSANGSCAILDRVLKIRSAHYAQQGSLYGRRNPASGRTLA